MSGYVETPTRALPAGGAIAQYLRVIPSAGQLVAAGASDVDIGTMEAPAFVAGTNYAVRLRSAQGTTKMVAAGAITLYAAVYGAAGGKISATPNGNFIGYAISAATGNGSVIEVLRICGPALGAAIGVGVVEAHTASAVLTAADAGKTLTNNGAAGEVDFTLPAATVGLQYSFALDTAQLTKVLPNGTDQIGTPSTATVPATGALNTAGHGFSANAVGATLTLLCTKTGVWSVMGCAGNWTAL